MEGGAPEILVHLPGTQTVSWDGKVLPLDRRTAFPS